MIEEIMKLRRKGLSFRKIADELDTTVGKVQYQWKKYKKNEEAKVTEKKRQGKIIISSSIQSYLNKKKLNLAEPEHITSWILSENKLLVFWRLSNLKKDLVSGYFDKPFNSYQKVLRIYDVTNILFNGSNAYPIQEWKLKEGQTVSILSKLESNRIYIIEMGIILSAHKFLPLLRSNPVQFQKGNENQEQLEERPINIMEETRPEWVEHVSTYSYYDSILTKDDRS